MVLTAAATRRYEVKAVGVWQAGLTDVRATMRRCDDDGATTVRLGDDDDDDDDVMTVRMLVRCVSMMRARARAEHSTDRFVSPA